MAIADSNDATISLETINFLLRSAKHFGINTANIIYNYNLYLQICNKKGLYIEKRYIDLFNIVQEENYNINRDFIIKKYILSKQNLKKKSKMAINKKKSKMTLILNSVSFNEYIAYKKSL